MTEPAAGPDPRHLGQGRGRHTHFRRLFRPSVNSFVALCAAGAVITLGLAGLAAGSAHLPGDQPRIFWLFSACALVTELRPLRWLRRNGGDVTASWIFIMAILLCAVPVAGIAAAATVTMLGELSARKPPLKIVFNTAQMVLAAGVGTALLSAFGQSQALTRHTSPATTWYFCAAAACAGVFAVNALLTCTVIGLHQQTPVLQSLRNIGPINLSTDGMLLALSPILVVVSERALALVPLLLGATMMVYRSTKLALTREHEATHDLLTEVPNRRLFEDLLERAVQAASRSGAKVGVVILDLDGFKEINDSLGHETGDRVLVELATRMDHARRPADVLARLGGDEFALLINNPESVAAAYEIAGRLSVAFDRPCCEVDVPLSLGASFGLAVMPDHGTDSASLMRRADSAMYRAKTEGLGVAVHEPRGNEPERGRIELLADLGLAIGRGELFVEYQPQVNLATERIVRVEALVRWRHAALGVIQPSDFMALAEQTEVIYGITEWVIGRALEDCRTWHRHGLMLEVAVNISARDVGSMRFPGIVKRSLDQAGLTANWLSLEITENTAGRDFATKQSVLRALRDLGVTVAIDDFGTGYSSMAQLREMPVDQLKVDRSFVQHMAKDPRDASIVDAILKLAQALGIETVAEGVEDPEVASLLRAMGCDTAQGYLFAKPMCSRDLVERFSPPEPLRPESVEALTSLPRT
jgi:diguanylate cyclase (GGDEF)-like protein